VKPVWLFAISMIVSMSDSVHGTSDTAFRLIRSDEEVGR
jgi:hypothetical protein